MYNALTIDVEDYYMVSAFAEIVKFEDWHGYESRVEMNTYKILDLLNDYSIKATFFILGWIAVNHPLLIRDIHSAGHEIACHGYNHRLIYDLTPEEFREDARKAKSILEDITGEPVIGYRATSYSVIKETLWALDILIDEGFLYDSSIFPIYHDRYGLPGADRYPHFIERKNGKILEFPPSTFSIFKLNVPVAGGGYLRLLPLWITRAAIRRINEQDGKPAIMYFHPWEIDPQQPRLKGRFLSRFRHYVNLNTTIPKLKVFLEGFAFKPLSHLIV